MGTFWKVLNEGEMRDILKIVLSFLVMALLAAACSSPEPEPTPTPEPTSTPLPTHTPEPTATPTQEPTTSPTPTAEPEESPPEDTSDLFVGPGYAFRFPVGWIVQVFGSSEVYYGREDYVVFSTEGHLPWLVFEIVSIDELGGDPSQAIEHYADLRMDALREIFAEDLEIINRSGFTGITADGAIDGLQIEWVIPSGPLEGLTQLTIDPNGVRGYMFEGVQIEGAHDILGTLAPDQIVVLALTSFFPIGTSPGSAYAPFGNPFTDFGFAFGIPGDAQETMSSLTGGSDEPASTENGLITIEFPSAIPELRAYMSWNSSDAILNEKELQDLLKANAIDFYSTFSIVGLGKLDVALFDVEGQSERFEGRYLEGDVPSGQAMLGAWQCASDRRVYVLQVENDFSATFLETLYLFQRFIIGFACP